MSIQHYPMPDIRRKGAKPEPEYKLNAEDELLQLRAENRMLKQALEEQRQIAEKGYEEAAQIIKGLQKKSPQPYRLAKPKSCNQPRVGFESRETWLQWTKKVLGMS